MKEAKTGCSRARDVSALQCAVLVAMLCILAVDLGIWKPISTSWPLWPLLAVAEFHRKTFPLLRCSLTAGYFNDYSCIYVFRAYRF